MLCNYVKLSNVFWCWWGWLSWWIMLDIVVWVINVVLRVWFFLVVCVLLFLCFIGCNRILLVFRVLWWVFLLIFFCCFGCVVSVCRVFLVVMLWLVVMGSWDVCLVLVRCCVGWWLCFVGWRINISFSLFGVGVC